MNPELEQRFKERAVELMVAIGVPGVNMGNLLERPSFREQFRAMLVDAKARHGEQSEEYAALVRLIAECDSHGPVLPRLPEPLPGRVNAAGSGFQLPRLDDPLKPAGDLVPPELRRDEP